MHYLSAYTKICSLWSFYFYDPKLLILSQIWGISRVTAQCLISREAICHANLSLSCIGKVWVSLPVVNPLSYPVQTSLSLYLNEVDISILYHFLWPCIEGHILFLLYSIHQRTYKGSTRFKRREHKFHLFTEKWQGQEEHVLLKLFLQSFLKCELAQFFLS